MNSVMVYLPQEVIDAVEALAKREDRTRGAQLRYLIRLGLAVTDPGSTQFGRIAYTPPPVPDSFSPPDAANP